MFFEGVDAFVGDEFGSGFGNLVEFGLGEVDEVLMEVGFLAHLIINHRNALLTMQILYANF